MWSLTHTRLLLASAVSVLLIVSYIVVAYRPGQVFATSDTEGPGVLTFSMSQADPVAMGITDSIRYQLSTPEGAEDFAKLLPSGGHVVYISSVRMHEGKSEVVPEPYTVTLFHQFRCLDIIRNQLNHLSSPISTMTRHCMNYLRQTILCRPNLGLESAINGNGIASRTYDAVCQDWTGLYEEGERNHKAFVAWISENGAKS